MHSILASSHSLRAAPLASSKTTSRGSSSNINNKLRVTVMRAKPAAGEEHFEPAEPRGECLLADARDAFEACQNLPPEDEAACMLALGCDAQAVHARLDAEEEEEARKKKAAEELAAKK